MKKLGVNRDIFVSLIFSVLVAIVVLVIILNGVTSEAGALLIPLRNYGIPLGGVALFLTWTCDKENLDERNRMAHKTSFHVALITTFVAVAFFIAAFVLAL